MPKFPPRGLPVHRVMLAAVVAWIVLLTVLILLDPHAAASAR